MDDLNAAGDRGRDTSFVPVEPETELRKDDCKGVIEGNPVWRKEAG